MSSSLTSPSFSSDSDAKRRRLEAESIIYQSDIAKLKREAQSLEIEARTLARDIGLKQARLREISDRRSILQRDIDALTIELGRIKKSMFDR